jgi:hypothetical protein
MLLLLRLFPGGIRQESVNLRGIHHQRPFTSLNINE